MFNMYNEQSYIKNDFFGCSSKCSFMFFFFTKQTLTNTWLFTWLSLSLFYSFRVWPFGCGGIKKRHMLMWLKGLLFKNRKSLITPGCFHDCVLTTTQPLSLVTRFPKCSPNSTNIYILFCLISGETDIMSLYSCNIFEFRLSFQHYPR